MGKPPVKLTSLESRVLTAFNPAKHIDADGNLIREQLGADVGCRADIAEQLYNRLQSFKVIGRGKS